ncbi:MAG: PAS domain-containing protein, partial [Steroidobacter sp.]
MFEFVTHSTSVVLGALVGAGALWLARRRSVANAADEAERDLRVELNLATEAAGIGTWRMDIASGKFFADTALQHILGIASAEVGLDVVHADDLERTEKGLRRAIESPDATFSLRIRIVRPDRKIRHVHTHFRRRRSAAPHDQQGELLGVSRDVTDEVERIEQQRRLADRLNMATEAAGVCCWEVNLEARRFLWIENPLPNLVSAQDLGYSLDLYREIMDPDDRDTIEVALRNAIENGLERISYRYRIRGRNGKFVHVQTHAQVMRHTDGNVHMFGVSWDTTSEVQAAEQLRQHAQMLRDAERRLERASLSSSEGHWEYDLEQRRAWFSSSYHTLLGYQDDELTRMTDPVERNVHPDDLGILRAETTRHLETGTVFDAMARLRMKSGEYRWFRHRGMSERDEQGQTRSMAGSIQDVHEQKLAEDALQLAQRRFERAINGTQDGLWEVDADGTSWCSPRVVELLGYEPQELASNVNFLKEFLHPEDTRSIAEATALHF